MSGGDMQEAPGAPAERTGLLIEAYLDGTLERAGAKTLAGLIRAGGPPAAEIHRRLEFTGLLGQALDTADAEGVARAVGERIDAEGETAAFARRVERSLPTRRSVRRRATRMPALAAAALVMVALLGGWWMAERHGAAASWQVIAAAPGSLILRAGSSLAALHGLVLVPGDTVQAAGAATLHGADGSSLVLDTGARLAIEAGAGGMRLRLERGELEADIAPQAAHRTVVLVTAQARVEVIGTRFTLDAAPTRTRLDLEHGVVRLTRLSDGAALEMHANQTATVADATAFAAQPLHPPASATTTAAGEAPLFDDGLTGWTQQHGSWSLDGAVVRGNGDGGTARLLGRHPYGDLVLTCRLRIVDIDRAEVQVGDYNWFITVPAASHQWIQLRLAVQGGVLSASADGVALAAEPGFGLAPRPGPLAFYVMRGRLEIADARIRTTSGGAP
jgi:ferric-dicitrate binding protein FerR (iron transport regulator)